MLPKLSPHANHYGHDVAGFVPESYVGGPGPMSEHHLQIWNLAAPHLKVRDNDAHTIYAYGIARALTQLNPDADPEVVLPGIILHDTGWSTVPEHEILSAIAPGSSRPELVVQHEKEGAKIAARVLSEVGHDPDRTREILKIIDGHDTRPYALSLNDSLLKDADKLWRLTPHGVDTVMDWFGLDREAAHRLIDSRVHDQLLSDTGRTMARILGAIVWVDSSEQRVALG